MVREALNHDSLGEVYGASHGLDGVLAGSLIGLNQQSRTWWERTARTPGAVLGTSRRKLKAEETPAILDLLSVYGIRYWFIIGGNDSANTGYRIHLAARDAGTPLTVIHVPKTIDNDLVLTDHAPGYGSAARFVAMATMGAGRDAEGMGNASPVTVIEVMGRDAGWLTAAAALGKRDERDAPHVICVPEVPVEEEKFLERLEEAYRRFGFAVAVVAENARGPKGVLGTSGRPRYVDDFGHPYYEGPGRYLAELASRHIHKRVRHETPGTIQRSFSAALSTTDAQEAEMVGRAAVRYALEGATAQMVTLVREPGDRYVCHTGLAPLEAVTDRVRTMPPEYFDSSEYSPTPSFLDYARPLIGAPLPRYERLR